MITEFYRVSGRRKGYRMARSKRWIPIIGIALVAGYFLGGLEMFEGLALLVLSLIFLIVVVAGVLFEIHSRTFTLEEAAQLNPLRSNGLEGDEV